MKKRLYLIFAAILAVASLSSCSGETKTSTQDQENLDYEDESTEESEEEATEETKEEGNEGEADEKPDSAKKQKKDDHPKHSVDYEEVYAPVFDEIDDVINNGYDGEKGYSYVTPGISEMASWVQGQEMLESLGYVMMDVDGNGVEELFIGVIPNENAEVKEKNVLFSGFTYLNGEIVTFMEGWSRNSYQWMGDNRFFYSGSGGAMYSAFGGYKLDSDKPGELVAEDFYFTDVKDDEMEHYHNQTGAWEASESEKMDIDDDSFWALMRDYESKTQNMPMRSFFERQQANASEASDASTEGALVTASFLEDVADEIGEYEEAGDYDKEYDRQGGKKDENEVMVVFKTTEDVSDFSFLSIQFKDVDENGQADFDTEELFTAPALKADKPLAVPMTFPGDMPTNGFSYKDVDGTIKTFSVSLSGYDGSLVTQEIHAL